MANVRVGNIVPSGMRIRVPKSASKAILRKELIEILPTEQSTYGPDGNTITRFNISSNAAFLSGPETYFRAEILRTTLNTTNNSKLALDIPGIESAIRSLEIRGLATGNLVSRMDNYHTIAALLTLISESRDEILSYGAIRGDGIAAKYESGGFQEAAGWQQYVGSHATIDISADGVITQSAILADDAFLMKAGDEVTYSVGDPFKSYSGVISYVESDGTYFKAFLDQQPIHGVITANAVPAGTGVGVSGLHYRSNGWCESTMRSKAVEDFVTKQVLCWKFRDDFFAHNLPLFLNKG